MAIERIGDYYPRFRKRTLFFLYGSQSFVVIVSIAMLIVLTMVMNVSILVAGLFTAAVAIGLDALIIVLTLERIIEPVKVMTMAINHVAKQATDLPPPDINEPRYAKSGLKSVVQTVYDLALNAPAIPNALPTATNEPARAAEAALSSANIGGLLEAIPCGIIALDQNGQIAYANRQAPVTTAHDGRIESTLIFDTGDNLETWRARVMVDKLRDNHAWPRIADKLPEEQDRHIYDVIAQYEKGSASGYDTIIVTVDRTEQYARSEEDMDFIALAAHELRGPITVIRGYLDVLSDELGPLMQPDQKELIDRLNVSANRLSGYINNILNVSRYDRRHLQLHLHEDSISTIVTGLWPDLEMRARTQNRLLSSNIPDGLPTIAADRNSLSEVIANLVDNAIKYSNDGGQVIVSAGVKGDFVECTVQDFGIGIPASVAGNLFSKFYRSHVSRAAVAGTGLGLYISKAIVDSHGGQIWVRSTEGQGTTFGFSVPIYSTVADKLLASGNTNEDIIESSSGWIKNHAMVRK